jgi:hypothetical protein
MKRIHAIAMVVGLALLPAVGLADSSTPLEELVSKMADTPAEHQAVADYFRSKAKDARAQAESHARMGQNYSGGKMRDKTEMQNHCKKIVDAQEALAAEYEALAKLHEAEAKAKP